MLYRIGQLVYETVVASIVTYAASAFEQRMRMCRRLVESLRAAQRPVLFTLCKAYRTSSTATLCVLVGVLPVDYLVLAPGKDGLAGPYVPGAGKWVKCVARADAKSAPRVFDS